MLTTVLDLAGMALIVAGFYLIFPPAGLIAAGVFLLLVSYLKGGF